MDKAQDELLWKQDMEDEVEEARDEHADEYARKMLLYKENMDKWEKQQAAKVCQNRRKVCSLQDYWISPNLGSLETLSFEI